LFTSSYPNSNKKKKKINWDKQYLPTVREQLADFEVQGIKPTFRGMYYTLVDLGVLPKTEANYSALNKVSVRWRESGLISIDSFADSTRSIVKNFDDVYETLQDYVHRGTSHLEYADENYQVPLWYKQPHYVEIWLEKNAAVGTFESIVEDLQVVVVPNRGHSSVAFINDNIRHLKKKQAEGKEIHILYFGDEDPSGEEMDKVYKRKFAEYGLFNVDFVRLAVTKDQKERFDLQTDPDPETLEKLQKDPNRFKFMEKYGLFKFSEDSQDEFIIIESKRFLSSYVVKVIKGGYIKHDPTKLFAVQLEAMQTPKVRAYLRALVRYYICKWFDKDIRDRVLREHQPDKIRGLVLLETGKLLDRLQIMVANGKTVEQENE
jgi:hypothetical protein